MNFLKELLENEMLVAAVVAWTIAQFLKTMTDYYVNRNFNPERLVGSGGMPSSHSSTVCALVASAAIQYGVSSQEFAISFVLAAVVMYDAVGVRREAGKQAKVLNAIIFEHPFEWKGEEFQQRLKEYIGHTPLQVLMGAILGVGLAYLIHLVYI